MAVEIIFTSEDLEEIEFAKRYWAMDDEGEYIKKVSDLLPFRDLTQPAMVAKYIRTYCQAYDLNTRCPKCEHFMPVNSRAEPAKSERRGHMPCPSCTEEIEAQKLEKKREDENRLQTVLSKRSEAARSTILSYESLADDVCLILQAIGSLTSKKINKETFNVNECKLLSPTGAENYVRRLRDGGILFDDPSDAPIGTYQLHNDALHANPSDLALFLPPDEFYGTSADALALIEDRDFTDGNALTSLWLDYATDDVIKYFIYRSDFFRFEEDIDVLKEIKAVFRQGLNTYSVSQLWFLAYIATKDASSLANHQFWNHPKAFANIPNKLRKLLEKAEKEGGIHRIWHRSEYHFAGELGSLFRQHFGITEYTCGKDVLDGFRSLGKPPMHEEHYELEALASVWLERIKESGDVAGNLERLAECVREGADIRTALKQTLIAPPC